MKLCKVEIVKRLEGAKCTNFYPVGYNPNKINIVAYDENPLNEGDNTGYCMGLVADNFSFTDDMVEITKTAANTFIDSRASIIEDADDKARFKATRKAIITDAGI